MTIVGLLSRLLGTDPASIHSACIKIYEDARRKRPGKPDRDYLKLVLFTKPPYDYQLDSVIDGVLNECSNIQEFPIISLFRLILPCLPRLHSGIFVSGI